MGVTRVLAVAVGLTMVAAVAGCGTSASPSATQTPPGTPAPSSSPRLVTATEGDNGRTLTLHRGQQMRVVLHSTYWTMRPAANAEVLAEAGQPVLDPKRTGCVAGAGCGTMTAVYDAIAAGRVQVVATRTSCGEAMRCTGSAGRWSVTTIVE
jgi:hypothetical protein